MTEFFSISTLLWIFAAFAMVFVAGVIGNLVWQDRQDWLQYERDWADAVEQEQHGDAWHDGEAM